ncbi:MAG: L-threonylcarbamoyladenylate synthase [Candidatus Sericytochromatia bacterium]
MARILDGDPTAQIAEALEALAAGRLVAFPTETVYGLGANALDPAAVARIFAAKGRPATNPLIAHVSDVAMAKTVVAEWPETAERLAAAFWPGPLTLVLPKGAEVPLSVTAGLPAVGVRVPAHPVAQALIRAAGVPVAAPSANPYMGVSPTAAEHVAKGMAGKLDLILDGGPATVGLESTVLDLTRPVPTVLRLGGLPVARLRAVLGEVAVLVSEGGEPEVHLPSPGLARRHYAPEAAVRLVGDRATLIAEAGRLTKTGERVGVLSLGPAALAPGVTVEAMPVVPDLYGARLYATLHAMDALGLSVLLVESPPNGEDWGAVRDRLRRATTADM